MCDIDVYTQSDAFKSGWVAGFYDARSDDGMRYLDDILRYGSRSDDERSFMAGYRAGKQARRGSARYSPEPTMAVSHVAA